MQFIEQYTTPNDNVVINPMLGHLEAYYGKRKVLADLYVEYADEQKFRDENKFYYNLTTEQLEKYNITIFVLDDMYKERDLPDFDKIYDNGFYHIYKKPYYFKNPKNI